MHPAVTTLPLVHLAFEIVASTFRDVIISLVCSSVSQLPTVFAPALTRSPKMKVSEDVRILIFGDRYCLIFPECIESTLIDSVLLSSHITALIFSAKT